MISSADKFVALRNSENAHDYARATYEEANTEVWLDTIKRYSEMKRWVVHNKTVPLSILNILADDESDIVREWVAGKRKLSKDLFLRLATDGKMSVR